ncbi:MAG TPA: ubiquinone/menaquinone biosynthesis methyltransferase [Anaerolineae bacterium]|nr:ubiquinone/menaquinone biosynthesis methyltransferase [Anaerolineae bacterium]
MTHLKGETRARYVQDMFARIASRYDLMNRLMTAGQDVRWRRDAISRAGLQPGDRLLDLGAGTGALAREARRQCPDCYLIAADFSLEMMHVGRARTDNAVTNWCAADALRLPYSDETFAAVVSGFLMRNVIDIPLALSEQHRVLKPGGRCVVLDTTRPPHNLLSPFIRFHMRRVIPTLGRLITGEADAYTYLPDSTEQFLTAEDLATHMGLAGFHDVAFARRMLGTIAVHWGSKAV